MVKKIVSGVVILSVFLLNSCGREKEVEPNDLSLIISTILIPTSTEESTDTTTTVKAYNSMPEGIPIIVDVGKSPIDKNPLDKGPFVNITKAIAHIGFKHDPDSLWGEWHFTQDSGWTKISRQTDSTITFRWQNENVTFTLKAEDFRLDNYNNILHAVFNLFSSDTIELAQLIIDTMEYSNDAPVDAKYTYNILNRVRVRVSAHALEGHNLRQDNLIGTIEGIIETVDNDTIFTSVNNEDDLSQHISLHFHTDLGFFSKSLYITPPVDSIPGYRFRDIEGIVLRKVGAITDTIGTLEGRIWHPQDASHRNYLDVILKDGGERIHLWNN